MSLGNWCVVWPYYYAIIIPMVFGTTKINEIWFPVHWLYTHWVRIIYIFFPSYSMQVLRKQSFIWSSKVCIVTINYRDSQLFSLSLPIVLWDRNYCLQQSCSFSLQHHCNVMCIDIESTRNTLNKHWNGEWLITFTLFNCFGRKNKGVTIWITRTQINYVKSCHVLLKWKDHRYVQNQTKLENQITMISHI